jgi:GH15 family glucan-1,4-alpha-glucosidase
MVAAPTTSLPEEIGGVRNWDYRYSWLRDSSMTLRALWVAACPDEAREYFRWIAETAERDAALGLDLQIVYGVGGERELEERVLEGLRGWRDSGPVRIGNGAGGQLQIDVYGEILDARSGDMGGSRSPEALRTLETHVLGRPGSGHRHGG